MGCLICGEDAPEIFAHFPAFTVMRCGACGFRFVDVTSPAYPRNAQYIHDEPNIGSIRPDSPHIQRRVRDILQFCKKPGRALDIGCGKGEVAIALHEAGFEATGVDMKAGLIDQLRERHPEVSWYSTSGLSGLSGRFDVLTMYHVLEHVEDPRSFMRSVSQLASPGALIVVEVPNVQGLEARLRGRSWHYYKVDHVSYFRPSDLRRLAAELGLTLLGMKGYQHFSYPQNVLWKDAIKGLLGSVGFKDVVSAFMKA